MLIAAGIVTFNDAIGLNRLLSTILVEDGIDIAIVVDGRFDHFEWHSDLSTDGTIEIVNEYSKTPSPTLEVKTGLRERIRYLPRPNLPEFKKRQEYMVESARLGADVLVVMDSDNYVVDADWKGFRNELEEVLYGKFQGASIFNILVESDADSMIYNAHPYVIARPEEVEYYANHHTYKKGSWVSMPGMDTLFGIKLRHTKRFRDPERELEDAKYKEYIQLNGL